MPQWAKDDLTASTVTPSHASPTHFRFAKEVDGGPAVEGGLVVYTLKPTSVEGVFILLPQGLNPLQIKHCPLTKQ